MGEALQPTDAHEAAEMIASSPRLEIRGGGSKAAYGAPQRDEAAILDARRLCAVVDYDPQEFVLTAGAGAPLAEIEALLVAHGQRLAFEPPDLGPILGAPAGRATLGGVLAANLSGPRRIATGAARDHLLGFEAVSGRGIVFKAGGRVVKNVTGFDLSKLMAGSWGALALLTVVTVRTAVRPRTAATLRLKGLSDGRAVEAMGVALGLPLEVSGAAHLPLTGETVLRLEGIEPSVETRIVRLAEALKTFGAADVLDAEATAGLWRGIGRLTALAGRPGALWRISVPPAAGAEIAAVLGETPRILDWAGGLVWAVLTEPRAAEVRALAERLGGHATLVRADAPASAPAFHPEPPALAALAARVRTAFDPENVFVDRVRPGA
jgi:glycolate oxidase FAD binding subunit